MQQHIDGHYDERSWNLLRLGLLEKHLRYLVEGRPDLVCEQEGREPLRKRKIMAPPEFLTVA